MDEANKSTEEKNPSMEQILQNIRGVISGKDISEPSDEVLELTEIVNDDGSISSLKDSKDPGPIGDDENNDVLNFIDDTLGVSIKSKEEQNIAKNDIKKSSNNDKIELNPETNFANNPLDNLNNIKHFTEEAIKNNSRLISQEAATASSEALKHLVKAVSKPIADGLSFRSGTTLEDLTVEIIKPYLSKWLDENLPNIVKNLVEKEIQKLIPKDED